MQNLLMILVPFFPALCAAVCWFVPAVREDKARDRFVLIALATVAAVLAAGKGSGSHRRKRYKIPK